MATFINFLKSIFIRYHKEKIVIPLLEGNLLNNKYALVTGGSSGIGYSIALSFLKNGASVLILGRNIERLINAKEKLLIESKVSQEKIKIAVFDISNFDNFEGRFYTILNETNWRFDIFVNNAGINGGYLFPNTTEKQFDDIMDINLKGFYFFSQIICNFMTKNKIKGNILNITSSSSLRPGISPYIISKWGQRSLTLGMAKKYIKYGIVVNALAPGNTITPMTTKKSNNNLHLESSPSKRYLVAEEVGNIATVLVSSLGRMIVGETVYLTGGSGVLTFDDMNY